MKKNKYEIDMCNGTIMDKLISFSLPLMVSGILQLMFNAVDIIVVGRFSGSQALSDRQRHSSTCSSTCLWESRSVRMCLRRGIMQRGATGRCRKRYIHRSCWR